MEGFGRAGGWRFWAGVALASTRPCFEPRDTQWTFRFQLPAPSSSTLPHLRPSLPKQIRLHPFPCSSLSSPSFSDQVPVREVWLTRPPVRSLVKWSGGGAAAWKRSGRGGQKGHRVSHGGAGIEKAPLVLGSSLPALHVSPHLPKHPIFTSYISENPSRTIEYRKQTPCLAYRNKQGA